MKSEIQFWDLEGQFICGKCASEMLANTRAGKLIDDERVTANMLKEAGEHGQCDNCNAQCEDYPDCEK